YKNRLAAAPERLHRSASSHRLSHLWTAVKALRTLRELPIHRAGEHFHSAREPGNRDFQVFAPVLRGRSWVESHPDQIRRETFPELTSRLLCLSQSFCRADSVADSHSRSPKTKELPRLRRSPNEATCAGASSRTPTICSRQPAAAWRLQLATSCASPDAAPGEHQGLPGASCHKP